jgi:hypothetical protein
MQIYEGFQKAGKFMLSNGVEVQGELCLNGAATTLDLYSESSFDIDTNTDISGIFYDRSKVSLIKCVRMSKKEHHTRGGDHYHSLRIFPHFVIFGEQHITSSCQIIHEMSFTVDDASTLFYDRDTFGLVINSKLHIERIIEEDKSGREIEIGESAQLFYFTGKKKIFVVNTLLGNILAWNSISYSFPDSEGIHVNNTIKLNINFTLEKTVEEAISSLLDMTMFLEIIAGRPQNLLELELLPANAENHPNFLSIYWCIPPRRKGENESSKSDLYDLPLKATINPDEFNTVLKNWLQKHNEWRNARERFSTTFAHQTFYNIDRVIGAANMFDILPSSAFSQPIECNLAEARDNALRAFQNLPDSSEKHRVLSALGQIGKVKTLKNKVQSRARLITNIIGDRFPELDMVLDQAVDCRNYYVHGSEARIDYNRHTDQVTFFTDTLEFVFAASDLVESGWDINAWANQGTTLSHQFGRYRANYSSNLSALKVLL